MLIVYPQPRHSLTVWISQLLVQGGGDRLNHLPFLAQRLAQRDHRLQIGRIVGTGSQVTNRDIIRVRVL